jgi:hypothetical protein
MTFSEKKDRKNGTRQNVPQSREEKRWHIFYPNTDAEIGRTPHEAQYAENNPNSDGQFFRTHIFIVKMGIVPFDVFTHCFVLRTKGVLDSFSFGLSEF